MSWLFVPNQLTTQETWVGQKSESDSKFSFNTLQAQEPEQGFRAMYEAPETIGRRHLICEEAAATLRNLSSQPSQCDPDSQNGTEGNFRGLQSHQVKARTLQTHKFLGQPFTRKTSETRKQPLCDLLFRFSHHTSTGQFRSRH